MKIIKNDSKYRKILIVAGGTGGHISPGIALYEEFLNTSGWVPVFLTLDKNKEYKSFQGKNWNLYTYSAPRISFRISDIFLFFSRIFQSLFFALRLIRKERIQVIIGMGGYSSVPALLAGIILRKKIFLCEQNVIPGKVTIWFSRFAEKVFFSFPVQKQFLYKIQSQNIVVGNPIRKELFYTAKSINPSRKTTMNRTILILGGSQGSLQLNEMLWNYWNRYPEISKQYQWLIQTGTIHYKGYLKKISTLEFSNQIVCFDFNPNIGDYLKIADVLICRAGAGNITEGILFGLPMILIPYPYAKDNHQLANAEFVEKQGMGIVVNIRSTNPMWLYDAIEKMQKEYWIFKNRIKKFSYRQNPSRSIVELVQTSLGF